MSADLRGKHIVLGISGGIAAYKSAILIRLLKKAGAEVQVIMTPSAREFITPLTLSTLSENPVISDFFTANTGEWHSHVKLGLWADVMLIAPATANTLAKMAYGIADNMLLTSYLSTRGKVFVAPAMDMDMWAHPSTQRNIEKLIKDGVSVIEPDKGDLASGLTGRGRMAEPEIIFKKISEHFYKTRSLDSKKYIVTAGPTYELIDPVRFIGNFSSGKMGFAMAEALADRGAEVFLIAGPSNITTKNKLITRINVVSAEQMYKEAEKIYPTTDGAIFTAAVADYRPVEYIEKKIKREKTNFITIELIKNPDIAFLLGEKKGSRINIGFALETDNEEFNAIDKLKKKNFDWIVLNSLKDKEAGFNKDTNKVTLYSAKGDIISLKSNLKTELAKEIIEIIFNQY